MFASKYHRWYYMTNSDAWIMIEEYWNNLEKSFSNIVLHEFIVMPNHVHWIIEITKQDKKCNCRICRDTPCGYPDTEQYSDSIQKNYFWLAETHVDQRWISIQDTHKGCPYNRNTIGNIIGSFKSKTTHQYIQWLHNNDWPIFNKKLWQKDFYEHIIRDEEAYVKISEYIKQNPIKWEEDKFYYTEV